MAFDGVARVFARWAVARQRTRAAPESPVAANEETLRRLALHDPAVIEDALMGGGAECPMDPKVRALIRLAGVISTEAPYAALSFGVDEARRAGASPEEIVSTLLAVGPTIGSTQLVATAPRLALALGWDVDPALEALDRTTPVA